jgi:hypothetical protein
VLGQGGGEDAMKDEGAAPCSSKTKGEGIAPMGQQQGSTRQPAAAERRRDGEAPSMEVAPHCSRWKNGGWMGKPTMGELLPSASVKERPSWRDGVREKGEGWVLPFIEPSSGHVS